MLFLKLEIVFVISEQYNITENGSIQIQISIDQNRYRLVMRKEGLNLLFQ